MITPNYNGIAEDPRDAIAKAKDYKHEDLAKGKAIVNWVEHTEKKMKNFEIQNQDGSSSCVAQATAKILAMHEVLEGREYNRLCPKFIYTRRSNYPEGGMWLPNALDIACKNGACSEVIMPCDNKGESIMNEKNEPFTAVANAKKFKGKYYIQITEFRNIDNVAEVLEQGYGVLLGFRFDYDEWTEVPKVNPKSKLTCGHGVAAVDYCIYKGEKALLIEDSWGVGTGLGGRRYVTESFLKERGFYAGYITSLQNFVFHTSLKMNSKGLDVKMLQEKLGLKVDGIFGKMTFEAVKKFQAEHGLKVDGIVGPKTNEELNK